MSEEGGSSWPEQDIIDKWLGELDLPIKIKFADVMELKNAVTSHRVSCCDAIRSEYDPMPDNLTGDDPCCNTQEVEQLRKSHAIELQCLMEEKDNEVSQLRNELEEWKKIDAADVKYLTEKREEAEQERDELTAYVNLIQIGVDDVSCVTDAMLLVKIIREGMPPLDGLPAQSLQAHDNEIIERCADIAADRSHPIGDEIELSIRNLKTEEGK